MLYGNSGGDWISGGTGDDGDPRRRRPARGRPQRDRRAAVRSRRDDAADARHRRRELGRPDRHGQRHGPAQLHGDRAAVLRRRQRRHLRRPRQRLPPRRRRRRRDVGRRGAAALLRQRAQPARRPRVARGLLRRRQPARATTARRSCSATTTRTTRSRRSWSAPGIDFLLNFVSATSFDATTPQPVVDDGQDVLFGDGGNDWLVGGTNMDVMFGGYGNDVLNADDNLDSTKVTIAGHVRQPLLAHDRLLVQLARVARSLRPARQHPVLGCALPLVRPDERPQRLGRAGHQRHQLRRSPPTRPRP